ncbi:MAG TPA: Gfo/Idh/MocA family oxidoreductase, partial [Abditibacteriaceae bacterium]|nr:Gfo/Idh/MocA family oxidoreductase [Abditibacteriaceae bacterium]
DGYVADLCVFLSDKETHDNGIALVEYDNNVRASHMECFVCNFTDRYYTIVGDRGILVANVENPTRIEFRPRWGENRIIEVAPAKDDTETDSLMSHGGADPLLVENFVAGIKSGTPHSSTVRDGIRAVAVGEAAERAWRNHRTVDIAEFVNLNDPSLIV